MNVLPKHHSYLDPTNKEHRDYIRLDISHSPDNVPDTPFNSPTATSLSNTEFSFPNLNPVPLNQLIMDANKPSSSSSHPQSRKIAPTSAPSEWRPASRDRAGSSESDIASTSVSASKECRCRGRGGGTHKLPSDLELNSELRSYSTGCCEQCILRDEGAERGRCRTRTNSSSSRDKTSCEREKRRLNL
ncbi:hypothetical protein SBOR_5951 [Sclerotinia borealis F-4128]|uniref:Uncharacterized protein n=1 Tax=Sclerotinia borealis (strain F-4128) TaxID=1432307 RepID=W9CCQ0_SCLBF|nr:hypothetical protein SBOR_5951 [Sclerotinia borealis F-4128]